MWWLHDIREVENKVVKVEKPLNIIIPVHITKLLVTTETLSIVPTPPCIALKDI